MRRLYPSLRITIFFVLIINGLCAQVPVISYSPSSNIYQTGTAITTLVPTNTGGAVPATTFGTVSTFVSSASNINNPRGMVSDGSGNFYETDYTGNYIYKINSSGTATVIAGTGVAGEVDNTTGTSAKFNGPTGIVYDGSGYLYVTDYGGNKIRKVSTTSPYAVTTIAGSGTAGEVDGNGTSAQFNAPAGIAYDGVVYLYITDYTGNKVRRLSTTSPYTVNTIAGTGTSGETNNTTGTSATFKNPAGIVYDGSGNLYVCDFSGNTIREINTGGTCTVTTFAGSGTAGSTNGTSTAATFKSPWGIAFDASKNLEIADEGNNLIRTITPGAVVTTLAGSGSAGETNGVTTAATFTSPYCVVVDNSGNCIVGDNNGTSSTCRKILLTGYTISATLPSGLTFTVTNGNISGTPTATSSMVTYTITGYNANGSGSTTVSIAVGQRNNWTGSVSSNWSTAGNWSLGYVPTAYDNAYIAGGSGYTGPDPTVTTSVSVAIVQFGTSNPSPYITLTINSGATLTINTAFECHSGAQITIAGSGSMNVVPGADIQIINSTYPSTTTSLTINSTATVTLQSDATGDASLDAMPSGGTLTGNLTIQRYLTGGSGYRGYRLLSSPIYAATVSPNKIYSINYLSTYAYLTGTSGTTNGFDKSGNPTLYLYREDQTPSNATFTSGNFWGISKINNATAYNYYMNGGSTNYNIPVGNGYLFFFRGNRSSATLTAETVTTYVPVSATLSVTGMPNYGSFTVHDWYTPSSGNLGYTGSGTGGNYTVRGFNLVGNPYPCSIDWENFNTSSTTSGIYGSSISTTIYELNPLTKNYDTYQQGGASTNYGSNIIASGQGFFVLATSSSSPTLIFNETAKTSTQNTGMYLFMAGKKSLASALPPNNAQHIKIQLARDSINADDTYIGFRNTAGSAYDPAYDAPYKPGLGEVSLASISSDNQRLAINYRALPITSEVIKLAVNTTADGSYTLRLAELKSVPQLFEIWLMDNYKKDSTNLRHSNSYRFEVNKSDTSTFGSGRFSLIIRQDPALAYHLLSFSASKEATATPKVEAVWTTQNEENYTDFTLERSTDSGKTFDVLGSVVSGGQGSYSFTDANPVIGQNLYRLKQEDINGIITYSGVVPVEFSKLSGNLIKSIVSVYPNPAKSGITLNINQSSNASANGYTVEISNSLGFVVKRASGAQPGWQTTVSDLLPGTYIVKVYNESNHAFAGSAKFVRM
ncbi:MAG: T9SS type A sorting domain-containing protein [Bacteroidetes bacterium]|nr:T9SS type A sorting domain-containing protein [Bacteroidota bacterium]